MRSKRELFPPSLVYTLQQRDGNIPAGSQILAAAVQAKPGLHRRRGGRTGAWNRNEHGDFLRGQFGPVETRAFPRPGPPGAVHEHLAARVRTRSIARKVS